MNKCLLCNTNFKVQINYQKLFFDLKAEKHPICSNCFRKFEKISGKTCHNCNKVLSDIEGDKLCYDCEYWSQIYPDNLLFNQALYRYNDAFHDLMVNYKRYGDYVLCETLAYLINKLPEADYYIPLPSSPSHFEKRRFDTIYEIYQKVVPLTNVLIKDDTEKAQGEKNRQQRLASKQTFMVKDDQKISGKILLLDDIYTTGRTLYHARDALQQAYSNLQIKSFTIAR